MVVINLHAGGTIIPIILTQEKCTSTTWGELCKEFMEKYLTKVDPRAIFKILLEISPTKRLSQYLIRYGGGNSSLIRVDWSSANVPGFVRLPFSQEYIDVNMVLQPRLRGHLVNLAKPHLPVQPVGVSFPASFHVDLCISMVSSAQPPFPYNEDRMSVLYLKEHAVYASCVDKFEITAADGSNNLLLDSPRVPQVSCVDAAAASTTAGKKRKAQSKEQSAPTKAKAKSSKKRKKESASKSDADEDGAKKPAAKEGGKGGAKGGAAAAAAKMKSPPKEPAAAKKKSPPKEPAAAGLKSPPKKSGEEMIQLYQEAEAAKKLKESSSSKTDSPSIPKVMSSKKTTKISPKKDKGKASAAKDSGKKPSTLEAGRNGAPSADIGNDMIRRYNESKEAKAKENAVEKEETPSKSKKKSDDSSKSSSSMKPKASSKKDKAEGDEGEITKKPSAAAAVKESGEGDKATPSVDNGNKMFRVWLAAQKEKIASEKSHDSTKVNAAGKEKITSKKSGDSLKSSPNKRAKGSSKMDEATSNEGKSVKKASAAAPCEKSREDDKATPSAEAGNKMIRVYEEAKANKLKESSSSKADSASIPKVISSKKATKKSPNKDEGKANAAMVDAKELSSSPGDVSSSAAAVDSNKIHLYNAFSAEASPAEKEKTTSKSDDSTKSTSSERTKGSPKKDKAKVNERQSAKKPSASEKEVSSKEADAEGEGAKASKKKRKAPTDASPALKSPIKKKSKSSKADETSALKVTFAADVKKSDAPIKTKPPKKSKKSPSNAATSNGKRLVHCGGCNGCLRDPCRKCSACTANPKKRCKKRPCHKPRVVSIAEYEDIMIGLV